MSSADTESHRSPASVRVRRGRARSCQNASAPVGNLGHARYHAPRLTTNSTKRLFAPVVLRGCFQVRYAGSIPVTRSKVITLVSEGAAIGKASRDC
jgi:hypothetical protein